MANVTVYSTPTCPWCKRAKQFLDANKVAYKDLNVASDVFARKKMVEKSGQLGVPVLDVDGQIVIGYDEPKLKELLKIK
mgnify:FL=1